jgi:DNA-binding CsgD family transcriptional regulator
MSRVAAHKPGSGMLRRMRESRLLQDRLAGFSLEDPRLTTALAHYAALAASLVILVVHHETLMADQVPIWLIIFAGFGVLRVATVGRRLAISTVLLDAVGMVVFLAGSGAPGSPFYLLALAGVWWAAQMRQPRSGLMYGLAFAAAYIVLVVPGALRQQAIAGVLEEIISLIAIGALSDWFVGLDRRALALNDALHAVPLGGVGQLAIREGLQRALRATDAQVDVVLTAGQVGLTVVQTELLSYLVLGLSTLEISDAAGVSEATTRYRLTGLYRALGVRGRRAAADRARELGLGGMSATVDESRTDARKLDAYREARAAIEARLVAAGRPLRDAERRPPQPLGGPRLAVATAVFVAVLTVTTAVAGVAILGGALGRPVGASQSAVEPTGGVLGTGAGPSIPASSPAASRPLALAAMLDFNILRIGTLEGASTAIEAVTGAAEVVPFPSPFDRSVRLTGSGLDGFCLADAQLGSGRVSVAMDLYVKAAVAAGSLELILTPRTGNVTAASIPLNLLGRLPPEDWYHLRATWGPGTAVAIDVSDEEQGRLLSETLPTVTVTQGRGRRGLCLAATGMGSDAQLLLDNVRVEQ